MNYIIRFKQLKHITYHTINMSTAIARASKRKLSQQAGPVINVNENAVQSIKAVKKLKKIKVNLMDTNTNSNKVKKVINGVKRPEKTAAADIAGSDGKIRCWSGALANSDIVIYHDTMWGRIQHGHPETLDRNSADYSSALVRVFSNLSYQIMQSGISWKIVFNKIPNFLAAFDGFDLKEVASYKEDKVKQLMENAGIVRNQLKIRAIINNAQCILRAERELPGGFIGLLFEDIDNGLFSDKERLLSKGRIEGSYMRSDFKTKSTERLVSDGVHPSIGVHRLAKRLKDYGFKFVGETVILSWMQAIGIMNHHSTTCYVHEECNKQFNQMLQIRRQYIENSNNGNITEANASNSSKDGRR
jgi:DNA-3-methyladenine glycosylase I